MERMQTFGERLKSLRLAANKTQEAIAEKIGLSRAGYMLLETDVNGKTFAKLPALAKAFGCSIDDLFPEMDDAREPEESDSVMYLEDEEDGMAPAWDVLSDEMPF